MSDLNEELNKEQLRVVYEGDGPCLVLSGPGSGKTRTLVYRAAHLLKKGVSPERILLLTFTRRAAQEMLSRIEEICPGSREGIYGGTFHSVGNIFLREYAHRVGYSPSYVIMDKEDSKSVLKGIVKEEGKEGVPKAQVIQSIISFCVNSQRDLGEVTEERFPYLDADAVQGIRNVYETYKRRKRENNVMDFDDLLQNWERLLSFSDIRKELSERFFYILVDEYQDTNLLQDEIVHKMSENHGNVLVVGDDAQSIYSFRAADVKNILNFKEKYPNSKTFRLETNYRSTPEILEIANSIMEKNENKLDKELKSVKGEGKPPRILSFLGPSEQAGFIADYVNNNFNEISDTAVLFRAHFHSVELELELAKRGIPYVMRGGMKFIEQFHVKDLMAFLRIFLNFCDESSWRRLLLRQEGVGEVGAGKIMKRIFEMENLEEVLEKRTILLDEVSSKKTRPSLEKLLFSLEKGLHEEIGRKIRVFREEIYDHYLELSFENARERMNDLKKIEELSLKYETLESMVSDLSLSEDFTKEDPSINEAVTLSTVHQAKGLEWKNVFIISLREGDFPHGRAIEEGSLEEERRLFYVALTRCKENLFLTYPLRSSRNEVSTSSRFLEEMDTVRYEEEDDGEEDVVIEDDEGWEMM